MSHLLLDGIWNLGESNKKRIYARCVVSVCEPKAHPYLIMRLNKRNRIDGYFCARPDKQLRRQDYPPAFLLNGAIFLIKTDVFFQAGTLVPPQALAYVMPLEKSLDIDDAWDLKMADIILAG